MNQSFRHAAYLVGASSPQRPSRESAFLNVRQVQNTLGKALVLLAFSLELEEEEGKQSSQLELLEVRHWPFKRQRIQNVCIIALARSPILSQSWLLCEVSRLACVPAAHHCRGICQAFPCLFELQSWGVTAPVSFLWPPEIVDVIAQTATVLTSGKL